MKPNTSRYANSERYIICKGFMYEDSSHIYKSFYKMLFLLKHNPQKQLMRIFNFDIPYFYTSKIEEYNAIFGQQQIETIISTLDMSKLNNNNDKIEILKRVNFNRCIQWCIKNKQPYNKLSPSSNIFLSANNHI